MAGITAEHPTLLEDSGARVGNVSPDGDGRARKAAVALLVTLSAGAHMVSAASSTGTMAWMMAGMGLACASCLVHLWRRTCAVRCASRHLLAMCAVMALFHMAWLTFPDADGHHQHGSGSMPVSTVPVEHAGHWASMLGVIGVELLCMVGATIMLRTGARDRRELVPAHPFGRPRAASFHEN